MDCHKPAARPVSRINAVRDDVKVRVFRVAVSHEDRLVAGMAQPIEAGLGRLEHFRTLVGFSSCAQFSE